MGARLIAVADALEAMAAHRPYRPALGLDAAMRRLEEGRGSQFDPPVVDACLDLFKSAQLKLEL
jgi:HD-GYP domain-containing protein (c-di-GMP phosphodiesterase class II)